MASSDVTAATQRDHHLTVLGAAFAERYRVERELGAGGMATVLLAVDTKHDRRVAIKVLRPELAAIIGAERFVREIKTVAALQHPHILGLIDSGGVDGTAYYVMPYVEGESLRDRLNREKQLPVADAIRIATEVASALDYAHRHGVIHRDIKPENVMLHDGSALVADFGIALAVSTAGGTRMTETGMSLGTPHYMSPEQAMGDREITACSDVYALGAMTYEMLVGDPPFTGSTAQAIVARALTESPRAMGTQRRTIPPHVEAAVLTALEKLPADRFATAADFAGALAGQGSSSTGARLVPVPTATGLGRARVGQVAATVAAVGFGVVALWQWQSARRATNAPATWQYVELGDTIVLSTAQPSLAISADGNTLVFKASLSSPLWMKRRGQLDAHPIAGTEDSDNPSLSPDGQWVAFVAHGQLRKVRLTGGAPVTLTDGVAGHYGGTAWMQDGSILYVPGNRGELRRVGPSGGATTVVLRDTTLFGGGIGSPVPLPDDRGVLFQYCSSGCATATIHVLDLKTGKQKLLLNDVVQSWYLPNGYLLYIRRDGAGFVARFNLKTLTISDEGVQVLQGVSSTLSNGYSSLAVSPTGTLVYAGGNQAEVGLTVVRVSATGAIATLDTSWSTEVNSIALSPDGRRLAVGSGGAVGLGENEGLNIWVKQLDAGPFTRLTFGKSDRRPAWSPDGKLVGFIRDSGTTSVVYARPADGSGLETLLARLDRQVQELVWSPDGKWLVLRTDNTARGNADILGIRTTGDRTPVPLVATKFSEIEPAVSPDSKWIAYVSNESGVDEVYVRPFPATNGGRWQVSTGGGEAPEWSPDGRQLYFVNANSELTAAHVSAAPGFSVTRLQPLFSVEPFAVPGYHQAYAVAPDGKNFYFAKASGAGSTRRSVHLVWVDHWFSDLAERLKK